MPIAYQLTTEANEIVLRMPRKIVDEEFLNRLLAYLEVETLRRQSQMTAAEAEGLLRDIKQSAWEQVQHLFDPI
ncbi:MAG: hypothetical protein KF753_24490 [Caldilineaceae bacterium]|nr:hypothetical protein [Caldilineaceae bacterium]